MDVFNESELKLPFPKSHKKLIPVSLEVFVKATFSGSHPCKTSAVKFTEGCGLTKMSNVPDSPRQPRFDSGVTSILIAVLKLAGRMALYGGIFPFPPNPKPISTPVIFVHV